MGVHRGDRVSHPYTMLTFHFGNWEITRGAIDGDFAYALAFLAVAASGAGRILGPAARIENDESGGRTLPGARVRPRLNASSYRVDGGDRRSEIPVYRFRRATEVIPAGPASEAWE